MPLTGLICPNGEKVRWNVCLKRECSNCFPLALRKAIFRFGAAKHKWVSVTGLLYCLKKTKLEHDNDYYLKPENAYYAMRGSIVHEILSSGDKEDDEIREEVFSKEIPGTGLILYGQIDRYRQGILDDYKTMASTGIHFLKKGEHKEQHVWQANIYKWLISPKYQVEKLRLIYLTMSNVVISGEEFRIRNKRTREFETFKPADVPMYTDEKVLGYITPKARLLAQGYDPPADPSSPWLCEFCAFNDMCKENIGKSGATVTKIEEKVVEEKKVINVEKLF